MNKADIYRLLAAQGISYEVTEHSAVMHMEELGSTTLPYPQDVAKSLFLTDGSHSTYLMVVAKGDKKIRLLFIREQIGGRRLTFASREEMKEILSLTPGSVTPLGVLQDEKKQVKVYIDKAFQTGSQRIGIHPLENTATLWLHIEDLNTFLRNQGTMVDFLEI